MIKVRIHPRNNWLERAGYTLQEEETMFDAQLKDILLNTRWYLDNVDKMATYRVRWHRYTQHAITLPYRYIGLQMHKKRKLYK